MNELEPAEAPDPLAFVFAAVVFYTLMGGGGVALSRWLLDTQGVALVGREPWAAHYSVLLGVGVAAAFVGLSRWAERFEFAQHLNAYFRDALGALGPGHAAALAATSALGEELLFRGFVLAWLVTQIGPWPAVVVSSAAFALMHVGPRAVRTPWIVFAALAGLAFGACTVLSGGVLAAVVAHGLINYGNCLALVRSA